MTFAENLRKFRVERFLSQRELARQAGLHSITLVRLEAGATAPSTRTVRALAAALGVEARELTSPEEVADSGDDRRDRLQRHSPVGRHQLGQWSPGPAA